MTAVPILPLPNFVPSTAAEKRRLETIRSCRSINTLPELPFDKISATARSRWGTPLVAIACVERQLVLLKSRLGIRESQVPRYGSIFEDAMRNRNGFVVTDASTDPRYRCDLVVRSHRIAFFAAKPILLRGHAIGVIAVMDWQRRVFNAADMEDLGRLACIASDEFEAPGFLAQAERLGVELLAELLRPIQRSCREISLLEITKRDSAERCASE